MKKLWCVIKKDILFQRKIIIGMLGFLSFWMIIIYEENMRGTMDVSGELYSLAIAAFGMIPAIYSCRVEQSVSTKAFLKSLPIGTKEVILGKSLFILICATGTAFILGVQSCIFHLGFPLYLYFWGITEAILIGSVYLFLVYLRSFGLAQVFFLCFFALTMKMTEAGGIFPEIFQPTRYPISAVAIIIIILLLSSYIIYFVIKKRG